MLLWLFKPVDLHTGRRGHFFLLIQIDPRGRFIRKFQIFPQFALGFLQQFPP
jgi:hypothetical protein